MQPPEFAEPDVRSFFAAGCTVIVYVLSGPKQGPILGFTEIVTTKSVLDVFVAVNVGRLSVPDSGASPIAPADLVHVKVAPVGKLVKFPVGTLSP